MKQYYTTKIISRNLLIYKQIHTFEWVVTITKKTNILFTLKQQINTSLIQAITKTSC